MASQHPVRAAIAAAAVPAAAVLAFGNQWFTENVRFEAKTALARRGVDLVGGPFPWRFSPYRGDSGTAIWMAQILGVLAVVGLTFLVAWLAARATANVGVFLAVWGGTVLTTAVAYWLSIVASYDARYDGREIEPGLNWFWYAFFHSTDGSLWAIIVGVVAGGAAALFGGGEALARRVTWSDGSPNAGPTAWGHQPPAAPPGPAAPAWGGTPAPVDAPPPPAPWGTAPPPGHSPPPPPTSTTT